MKVNIFTSSSFHVLDLARELQNQGIDVRFYSYLPHFFTRRNGLKDKNAVSLFFVLVPFLIAEKLFKSKRLSILKARNAVLDWCCRKIMRKADISIALGSVYYKILDASKEKGSITILEWGSKHIIEQRKCFGIPNSFNSDGLKMELESYDKADYIAIASQQVAKSFMKHGMPGRKLIINPYGVDINDFPPTEIDATENYDLITVGGWRYEKGSDLLIELCKRYGYSLLHVGGIVNMEFPNLPNMKHVDSVPQSTLTNYYKKAKVFVLPSRADGFGMVLIQAMASGLPIVCSSECGGPDMVTMIDEPRWISVVDKLDILSLKTSIDKALLLASTQNGLRSYTSLDNFTWKKYGERYKNNLEKLVK